MPVTLLSFMGEATQRGSELKWETAQEFNTNLFELQWSEDARYFAKIGSMPASVNSPTMQRYQYLHATPSSGVNYYRLKMVDADERFTYSPVIKINNFYNSKNVTLFPNPVTDMIYLEVKSLKNESVRLYLYNAEGKMMDTRNFKMVKGSNQFAWNVQTLAPGRYSISSANKQFTSMSIIKQ